MRLFLISIAMLCAFSATAPCWAASPLASDVVGHVVDANKQPIAGAVVILEHLETGRVLQAITNERGRYHFANVRSDGNYRIEAEATNLGFVRFAPAPLQLGHVMRRNFVLGVAADPRCQTFGRFWQWNQWDHAEVIDSSYRPYGPATCPTLREQD